MESNNLTPSPIPVPSDKEQQRLVLFVNIRNFSHKKESQPEETVIQAMCSVDQLQTLQLQGIRQEQQVRLVGKPYSMYDDVDYFLAISG